MTDAIDPARLGKALYRAAGDGDVDRVKQLLAAGAPPNWQLPLAGTTALHKAAGADNVEVARALVDGGADVHVAANTGSTACHWAVESGAPTVLAFLLTTDAVSDLEKANFDGETPISLAAAAGLDELAFSLSQAADDAKRRTGDGAAPPAPATTVAAPQPPKADASGAAEAAADGGGAGGSA